MAFCPECGKAVTPDEAVCTNCGKQLRSADKKARGGRFNGTMMMTAPEVKQEPPANLNAQRQNEQAKIVASAAAATSPRVAMPAAATRSSHPPGAQQTSNPGAPTLGRSGSTHLKATMIGAAAPDSEPQKPEQRHATMVGAALAPTTPRSKPPAAARGASSLPAPATPTAKSDRPPVVRQTTPQASSHASVRAVQSMPVSASEEDPVHSQRAPAPAAAPVQHDAQTVPSPIPPRGAARRSPNPARMVQAIPEVAATVVDPSELRSLPREYLPGDPMAPQPPAAKRAPRLREHPFAPDKPEVEGTGNYVLLYWAVCVAFVAAVCALAFRLF